MRFVIGLTVGTTAVTDQGDPMSALLERPTTMLPEPPVVATPAPSAATPRPASAPIDLANLAGNPVAAAHARRANLRDRDVDTGRLGHVLVLAVVVPTILFLVSNPLGWLLLFLTCLAVGAVTGIGSIL
jgi:hypothetical protein